MMHWLYLNFHSHIFLSSFPFLFCFLFSLSFLLIFYLFFFFFQAEDGIRDADVTGVQTCALPIFAGSGEGERRAMNYEYRKKIRLFTGTANPKLAHDIARYLELPMGKAEVGRFQDGEISVRIGETVRGAECFVIQPTCAPADTNLMELLIMIDGLKRASAKSITAVMPYYGYARQDRKLAPHDPIVARLVADLLTTAGADRILTMDLHAGQIQGFFDGPVDNLKALPILTRYFLEKNLGDMVVVSPDVGGVARAREL